MKYRLFVDALSPGALVLDPERAHYVRDVLRLREGAKLRVLSSDGLVAVGTLSHVSDTVTLEVGEVTVAKGPAHEVTLLVATPKGDRADWVVEKLTELGVHKLVWVRAKRSVVVPKEGGARRERWERLSQAAAQQCGRAGQMLIEGPVELRDALNTPAQHKFVGDGRGEPLVALGGTIAGPATLLIGPEGGLTSDELLLAQTQGYAAVALGPYTLRVETAAVAGAAVLLGAVELR